MSPLGDSWQPHMRDVDRDLGAALQRQFATPDLSAVLAQVHAAAAQMPAGATARIGHWWMLSLLLLLGLAGSAAPGIGLQGSPEGLRTSEAKGLSAALANLAVVGALAGSAALRQGRLQKLPRACREGLRLPEGYGLLGSLASPLPGQVPGEVLILEGPRGRCAVLVQQRVGAPAAPPGEGLASRRLGGFDLWTVDGAAPALAGFALSAR